MKPQTLASASIVVVAGVLAGALIIPNALGLAAAGDEAQTQTHIATQKDDATFEQVVEHLRARYGSMDAFWLDKELRHVLPNVEYSVNGAPARPIFGGVVQGRVTAIAEGGGYRDDGAQSVEVGFDSPDATWRMIVLSIEVENDFDPTADAPATVQLGVTFAGGVDPETMISAFQERNVLAVLEAPGTFRLDGLDESIRSVLRSGGLLGFVADDGTVSMPFLGEDEAAYLNGLTTLDAIIAASEEPKSVINVTTRLRTE